MKNTDPTREEMLEFLNAQGFDEFDAEVAVYMFAELHHGGQWSNLYSALSTSEFSPGPLWTHDREMSEESGAAFGYDLLVAEFAE